ncbi:glycerophosphodiester phosphodiesterase [Agromyces protaetiae]|uniref:glycerophosphodiester phosphodiesterase n=1 Tax=Agromyces protaetiae TaxID=2509455 RepID=A0A4P6FBJ4_9MICO|nr:glycerophosphodiester phosphodiesterase family protein [Agromyces protaetiae]QAY73214.1 glycerophosphodiester phosphodiesterase [Agromyces protaetiae]
MLADRAGHPIVIGHRGAPGYRPEHTAEGYELAFALGADAVEPDLVATRDGVLVLRHENEIGGTTDVAERSEFASRRTVREIDGKPLDGWFTEDFTWAELSTLRSRERIPETRPLSRSFDGRYPVIRLRDLFQIVDRAADEQGRMLRMVAEFKHASHFDSLGLPLDELFIAELEAAGWGRGDDRLVMESFEPTLLDRLGARGIAGKRVFLIEAVGAPYDQVLANGRAAVRYDDYATEAGLLGLAGRFDGVSVDKARLVGEPTAAQKADATILRGAELVDAAHSAGLAVYTWTLRAENRFLTAPYRHGTARAGVGDWAGEFGEVIGTGVDGIFVDQPDLGVAAREFAGHD